MASITLTGADLTLLGYTLDVRETDLGGIAVTLRNASGDPVNAAELMPREFVDEFDTFAILANM